jgi:hypothetical protein
MNLGETGWGGVGSVGLVEGRESFYECNKETSFPWNTGKQSKNVCTTGGLSSSTELCRVIFLFV